MANDKKIQLTAEGLEELKAELKQLKTEKLPKVIARVSSAREQGDLSENADYHSAKEEQNFVETRISEIEDVVSRAKVVKGTKSTSKVGISSKVEITLKGKPGKTYTYEVVGEFEADPEEGKVSAVSPMGKALLGKKKGESISVIAPAGEIEYIVKNIK
ncbi:MAG: transcription elongation factor GreA [Candidatus Pacebacteria bacterium]|jgi:transcription elongation factor GreA|nr:transcription elongation factor GreA [Candidatus Paceibacterota bacterium]MBT4651869.1 transcription elongation factor GreA [Candidatus Paceibacterota bacterium]MBT6755689.1 transcription elongation factor GreA [Candidatus Paceibacterota bacterium]MBT6921195.1 transcription elongation factor GreA [Candidatus Paceibacterota bacterium]